MSKKSLKVAQLESTAFYLALEGRPGCMTMFLGRDWPRPEAISDVRPPAYR